VRWPPLFAPKAGSAELFLNSAALRFLIVASLPAPVGCNPLGAARGRRRQWQIEDRDSLALGAPSADRDNLIIPGDIDGLYRDFHAEDFRLERQFEVVLNHGVEPHRLLRLAISVHGGLFDERTELCLAQPKWAIPWLLGSHLGLQAIFLGHAWILHRGSTAELFLNSAAFLFGPARAGCKVAPR